MIQCANENGALFVVKNSENEEVSGSIRIEDIELKNGHSKKIKGALISGLEISKEHRCTMALVTLLEEVYIHLRNKDFIFAHIELDSSAETKNKLKLYHRLGFRGLYNPSQPKEPLLIYKFKNNHIRKLILEDAEFIKPHYVEIPLDQVFDELKPSKPSKPQHQSYPALIDLLGRTGGIEGLRFYQEAKLLSPYFKDVYLKEHNEDIESEVKAEVEKIMGQIDCPPLAPGSDTEETRRYIAIPEIATCGWALAHLVNAASSRDDLPFPILTKQTPQGFLFARFGKFMGFKPTILTKLEEGIELFGTFSEDGKLKGFNNRDSDKLTEDKIRTIESLKKITNRVFKLPESIEIDLSIDKESLISKFNDWISSNPSLSGVVIKPHDSSLGRGVFFSHAGEDEELGALIDYLKAVPRFSRALIQERILPMSVEFPDFINPDWNIRVLGSKSTGIIDAEIRVKESGGPVNKSTGAKVIPIEEFLELGFSDSFKEKILLRLNELCLQIAGELDLGFTGIDVIVSGTEDDFELYIIEVNGQSSGGIDTLFKLRQGSNKNKAAEKALEALDAIVRAEGKQIEINSSNDTPPSAQDLIHTPFELYQRFRPREEQALLSGMLIGFPKGDLNSLIEEYCHLFLIRYSMLRTEDEFFSRKQGRLTKELCDFSLHLYNFYGDPSLGEYINQTLLALALSDELVNPIHKVFIFHHLAISEDFKKSSALWKAIEKDEESKKYTIEVADHLIQADPLYFYQLTAATMPDARILRTYQKALEANLKDAEQRRKERMNLFKELWEKLDSCLV